MTDAGIAARLHELVAALDRRRPQPRRADEPAIARAAAELRRQALARLAELDGAASHRGLPGRGAGGSLAAR